MVVRPELIAKLEAARGPNAAERLLVIDPSADRWAHRRLAELPELLRAGDRLVVNDAATLPAALSGTVRGWDVELRLAHFIGGDRWLVGVLGAGSWTTPTELRSDPPPLGAGDEVTLGAGLVATVEATEGPHLATVRLAAPGGWMRAVQRIGEPVRYAYLGGDVPLASFQTGWASRPWASESPSAGLPLRWETLLALRARGIGVSAVTHAAGLSSIDGGELDRRLPFPERSDVPAATVEAIRATSGRVVAAGTTVVRALEGRFAEAGALLPGESVTGYLLGPETRPAVVSGLLTKLHEPGESHFELLRAFADRELLLAANADAARRGYHHHEFGDTALVLAGTL